MTFNQPHQPLRSFDHGYNYEGIRDLAMEFTGTQAHVSDDFCHPTSRLGPPQTHHVIIPSPPRPSSDLGVCKRA